MSKPAQIKGISFTNVKSFVLERYEQAGWDELLGTLDADDRRTLGAAVPVGWYDLALYARVIAALEKCHGDGDPKFLESFGRYDAARDLDGVLRLFFRVFDPGFLVTQTMKLWSRFFDTGTWVVERHGHQVVGTLTDWGIVDRGLCQSLVGYISVLLATGRGGRGARVEHVRCRANGHPACVFTGTWE